MRHRARSVAELVIAVVQQRRHAVARRSWWLVDKFLRSRHASTLAVILPTCLAVAMTMYRQGVYGLVINAENLIAIGGLPYLAIRAGRRYRRISRNGWKSLAAGRKFSGTNPALHRARRLALRRLALVASNGPTQKRGLRPCPAQTPPPNPTAAVPGDGRVRSSPSSRVH